MALSITGRAETFREFSLHETDTGSLEARAALLTARTRQLTEHLRFHKYDHHSRRGLLLLVGRHKGLLQYLQDNDVKHCRKPIERLGSRH